MLGFKSFSTFRRLAMQAKLVINFDQMNEPNFLAKSGTIVSAVTTNINFPEPWLPQIASLTVFTTAYKD